MGLTEESEHAFRVREVLAAFVGCVQVVVDHGREHQKRQPVATGQNVLAVNASPSTAAVHNRTDAF